MVPPLQYDKGIETQMVHLRLALVWGQEDGSQTSLLHVLSQSIPMKVIWLLTITRVSVITFISINTTDETFFPLFVYYRVDLYKTLI